MSPAALLVQSRPQLSTPLAGTKQSGGPTGTATAVATAARRPKVRVYSANTKITPPAAPRTRAALQELAGEGSTSSPDRIGSLLFGQVGYGGGEHAAALSSSNTHPRTYPD